MQNNPAVSVIVPLYNAEKYIGACLDSLLAQTFTDFEVIVVDDCSTDSGVDIVKNYAPKFGGRLKLSRMERNSSSGAMPRNKGMMLSRGKYVTFLDNDDMFTKTALEEVYTLAKKHNADVVYCDNNYTVYPDGSGLHKEVTEKKLLVDKPIFEPENLVERVKRILQNKYRQPQWLKLVRRDLIFEHEIFFPNIRPSDDDIWTFGLVFYMKKFLRVPNSTYIRRLTKDSIMRKEKSPQEIINFWLNPILGGIKSFDNLMSKHEFFQKNPQCRYVVLEKFFNEKFNATFKPTLELSPFVFYETVKDKFGKNLDDYDVLVSALFAALNKQQKIFAINVQKFNQFAAQAQQRIADLENELNRRS